MSREKIPEYKIRRGQEIINFYIKEMKNVIEYTTPELLEWKIGVTLASMANEVARDINEQVKKE